MPAYLLILAIIVGAAFGAALAWLALRARMAGQLAAAAQYDTAVATLRAERDAAQQRTVELQQAVSGLQAEAAAQQARLDQTRQRADELHQQIAGLEESVTALRTREAQLAAENAALSTSLSERDTKHAEQLALLRGAEKALKEAFGNIASEALAGNNKSFLELAKAQLATHQQQAQGELDQRKQAVENMVKPISESLGRFNTTVQEIEKQRAEAYGGISVELRALREAQAALHGKATELTDALRGQPTRWGRWGELQLRNLVEASGMLAYCDFCEQESIPGEDGARLRPDMLIRLAGGRHIAVDSKAPVELYLAALEMPTEDERLAKLQDYAAGVRRHVADLTKKSYWEHVAGSPEFVVMFMPGESFFSAVHVADPSLINPTAETRVILASPTTLLALLRSVAYGWKQVQLADNARQINDAAAELYKRVRVFLDHMSRVGRGLSGALESYNAAVGSLDTRVLPQARRMHELGASDGKPLAHLAALDVQARALTAPEALEDSEKFEESELLLELGEVEV